MKFEIELEKDHEIQIGAQIVQIKFVEPSHKELEGDHGAYKDFCIYINKEDKTSMKLSTYLHECAHVCESIYTFDWDHIQLNLMAESLAQLLLQTSDEKTPAKKSLKSPIYKKRNRKSTKRK